MLRTRKYSHLAFDMRHKNNYNEKKKHSNNIKRSNGVCKVKSKGERERDARSQRIRWPMVKHRAKVKTEPSELAEWQVRERDCCASVR